MSKKCKAYSESKLGLQEHDNRKAFYAGWDAAMANQSRDGLENQGETSGSPVRKPLTDEKINELRHVIDWTAEWSYIKFARAIERAVRGHQ